MFSAFTMGGNDWHAMEEGINGHSQITGMATDKIKMKLARRLIDVGNSMMAKCGKSGIGIKINFKGKMKACNFGKICFIGE